MPTARATNGSSCCGTGGTRPGRSEQEQLRADVVVLDRALWAAAADGRLDGPSEEAASARHLLRALDRIADIFTLD